jgi:hypothetical protein
MITPPEMSIAVENQSLRFLKKWYSFSISLDWFMEFLFIQSWRHNKYEKGKHGWNKWNVETRESENDQHAWHNKKLLVCLTRTWSLSNSSHDYDDDRDHIDQKWNNVDSRIEKFKTGRIIDNTLDSLLIIILIIYYPSMNGFVNDIDDC